MDRDGTVPARFGLFSTHHVAFRKVYILLFHVQQFIDAHAGVAQHGCDFGNVRVFRVLQYGVDFALKKDTTSQPPRYLVFFKSRDADALTAAFAEYSGKVVKRKAQEKPSVRGRIVQLQEVVKNMIYQYAAPTKAETISGMKETVPVIKDLLTRVIMENAIEKLQKIPEPECSQFIADNKARFLAGHENSIRRRLAEAKAQTKQPIMQGHDLTGMERFHPETRHMIVLDIKTSDSPVGFPGERHRYFLSDEGYRNARASEGRGEIKIKSHAAVAAGKLYPDRKPERER